MTVFCYMQYVILQETRLFPSREETRYVFLLQYHVAEERSGRGFMPFSLILLYTVQLSWH